MAWYADEWLDTTAPLASRLPDNPTAEQITLARIAASRANFLRARLAWVHQQEARGLVTEPFPPAGQPRWHREGA